MLDNKYERLFEDRCFTICQLSERLPVIVGNKTVDSGSVMQLVRRLAGKKVNHLLVCAAGQPSRKTEDFDACIATDHINLSGKNPLIGHDDERVGPRFPDMSQAYDPAFMEQVQGAALQSGIRTDRGAVLIAKRSDVRTDIERRARTAITAISSETVWVSAVYSAVHAGLPCGALMLYENLLPETFGRFLRQLDIAG